MNDQEDDADFPDCETCKKMRGWGGCDNTECPDNNLVEVKSNGKN